MRSKVRRRSRVRRTGGALLSLALAGPVLAGCVQMPTAGPVVEVESSEETDSVPGVYFDPLPPQPGESATEIVNGFLEAMTATPIKTSVARQFLTEDAQATWAPERQIITYGELDDPTGDLPVTIEMTDVNTYDERGAWQRTRGEDMLELELAIEDDEWRISAAPDALVVPAGWFDDWYQRVSLYFFDPTAEILVPEPVHVPRGDQLASSLVKSLLIEAPAAADAVVRSFFPPGITSGLSVPISPAGIAEVSLGGDPATIDEETGQRMLTQLVWTLRQEPRIRAVDLTVDEQRVGPPGGPTQVDLDVGGAYDPNAISSTGDLFALREGRVVRGSITDFSPTSGPMGEQALGVRSVAASLDGTRVAGVSGDGSALLVAPTDDPDGKAVEVASGLGSALTPAWDFRDRLWLVDRARSRARVLLVVGDNVREVQVPGVSGRDVRHFLVSRDGSRFVAVVHGRAADRVLAGRIQHEESGRVLGVTDTQRLAVQSQGGSPRLRDLAWRSPTTVSVLSDINDDLSQVRTVSVDGAPGTVATGGSNLLRGAMRDLVSSPVTGTAVLAVGGRVVVDLSTPGRVVPELPEGLTAVTYAG